MAFLVYSCCGCFGRDKSSHKKAAASGPPRFPSRRFSQENLLLGITIDDLGKASMGKGGRPASKSPVPSAAASGTNRNGNNRDDLEKVSRELRRTLTVPAPLEKFSSELRRTATVNDMLSIGNRGRVKETTHADRYEDSDEIKIINEYARVSKIGTGSYGKVVLHRSRKDNQLYAIKIFHKPRLRKLRVAPAATAMMDVLREVNIMKQLDHPNVVQLVEVIDDPECEYFYMVLEYVERGWIFEGSGPPGGIGADLARRYFSDVVAGLTYLHKNNIVHGDIKPENLLISREGRIKICDFGVSQNLTGIQDDNDELRRSPGTPVYTAPECCQGVTYRGRAADIWALGCTLYCMVLGRYPFVGNSLENTYEKIVTEEIWYPTDMDPDLLDLLRRLLCKDPKQRLNLDAVANHPWVTKGDAAPFTSSTT